MKKLGLLFATVIMIMLFAFSASAATEGYYTYEVENGVATITDVDTSISGDVTIPSTLGGYSVTSIGRASFSRCRNLSSVTFSKNIMEISDEAFEGCTGLKSIELPSGLKRIGVCAFKDCELLVGVTIPEGVECIAYRAFFGCTNLERVNILEGVTDIEAEVFCNSPNIKIISFPKSLVNLGVQGFYNYDNITDIYYAGQKSQWEEIEMYDDEYDKLMSLRVHYNSNHLTHPFSPTVTAPTCIDNGYTTHACECGYIYYSDYVEALGHKYSSEITTPATHLKDGVETYTCVCGDTYTEIIDKLKEHTYKGIITNPTCTTQGFTTYVCECGDSYKVDYINAYGHSMGDFVVVKESTCTEKGEEKAYCSRGDYYITKIIALKQHVDTNEDKSCDVCELYISSEELLEKEETGDVEIIAPVDPDKDFEVDNVEKSSDNYILVQDALSETDYTLLKAFDITLKNKDGVHVQPDGTVKVKLPLNWEKEGNYKVYRVNDDGTLTDMNAYRQGSHMVFDTDHFSIYVIVEEDTQKLPDDTPTEEEKSPFDFFKEIIEWFKQLINTLTEIFRSIGDRT